MSKKSATVGSTVLVSVLALAVPASAGVQVRTDLSPGDLVRDHGAGVVVPPPGQGVAASVTLASGGAETLTAMTQPDGSVVLSDVGSETASVVDPLPEILPESPPADCADGAYRRLAWTMSDGTRKFGKWKTINNWWFRPSGTPADVDPVRAREAVRRAVRNVVGGRNDCGMADQISATQDYRGDTTIAPNITAEPACGADDGRSVVGWGSLGWRSALAVACMWVYYDGGTHLAIRASDVRISPDFGWYADVPPLVCLDRYSIEGVMTHEFGHSYGLDHVDEENHGSLTMSTNVNAACRDDESTLGKGDVWGLQSLY